MVAMKIKMRMTLRQPLNAGSEKSEMRRHFGAQGLGRKVILKRVLKYWLSLKTSGRPPNSLVP
jgi:hypothetical protein